MTTVMTDEIWKDIEGYDGRYMVSNYGRVKNCQRNRILKPWANTQGYMKVSFKDEGVTTHYSVHRLVACAFIPNPNNLETVDHIYEVKSDNSVSNLRWATQADNARWANSLSFRMVSPSGVVVEFTNMTKFCRDHNLTQSNMHKVYSGERKVHKGWTKYV